MSNVKTITLDQGGRFSFKVTKTVTEDSDRFTITLGLSPFGVEIVGMATWVEATAAMNKFRDEFDDAMEALVQVSTLLPNGVHEES